MFDNVVLGKTGQGPVSLRQKVYEQIKRQIITCSLAPGQPLSEAQFADQLETSKTPIREALTSLQQDHLVEYIPNRGFAVTAISFTDVQEIFEARLFYETTLFKLALKYITDAEVEELESYSKVEHDLEEPNAIEFFQETNLRFHLAVAKIARNSRLQWHYANLLNEAQRLIFLDFKNNNIIRGWRDSHYTIVDALRARDEAAGFKAIEETLDKAKARILGL